MTVMMALAKWMMMAMAVLVPGGLVVLAAFFLARAVHKTWQAAPAGNGFVRARSAVTQLSLKDVWREARSAF